jgi:uncharacterized protein YggL (DUF469 family)
MLMSIFEVWDKLPSHAKIVMAVSTVIATLVKPTILLVKWIREKKNSEPEGDELLVPFSVKISSKKRKVRWYKEKLNNHNVFFQFNELIKYEIDSNRFSFGTSEKTRIFRQILRIYLGVLSDNIRKFYDSKVELDSLTDKEFSEHFDTFVGDTNSQIYRKFQDAFTQPIFNLVIMNEEKGFVHFIEKHKKHFINSVKEMIRHDKRLYDNTNYRKVWEMLSLLRLVVWVGLDDFTEYYEEFNGDLDEALKNK